MQSCNSVLQKRVAVECISWRGHGNLGDDLIFAAQQAIFGDVFDLGQWRSAPEAVLVGGGTFVPKRLHHPELVELSQRLPTAFFGTGIGDPLFWGTDHIPDWLKVMRNARFIGVRGPLSMERLAGWGIATDQIEWIGDPGLYFAEKEIILHRCKGELAVNLGITYGKLYGFDEQKVEKTIIATLKQLVRAGWNVTLVCAWPSDDEVIERLQSAVAVSAVEHWHDDYGRALESVAKFDVVLSKNCMSELWQHAEVYLLLLSTIAAKSWTFADPSGGSNFV